MNNQIYPTDLTDSQWEIIQELIPKAKSGGRPRSLEMRQVINGILYRVVGGIQWRMRPKEYPKWQSVYSSVCSQPSRHGVKRALLFWLVVGSLNVEAQSKATQVMDKPLQSRTNQP